MDTIAEYSGLLLTGTWMTIRLAAGALALGLILGLLGASAKLSRDPLARTVGNLYTGLVRGIPELLVVLVFYFGSPAALVGISDMLGLERPLELTRYWAGVTALGFMFGAYATEVFRGAILAIPKGQVEAARAFGMTGFLTFRRIVLPQVWRVALPGLGNLFLVLMKDTALVSVIGLNEIMRVSGIGAANTKNAALFYFVATLIYLSLTIVTMRGQAWAERWAARGVPREMR